ncbi:hypothetical protein [Sphingomonas sp. 28-62-11]|uniref:hypothetical protein n=1 Tax=Sphingomonas sp. 28-62-11 TaxID=1970432 RepID=UPI0035A91FF4
MVEKVIIISHLNSLVRRMTNEEAIRNTDLWVVRPSSGKVDLLPPPFTLSEVEGHALRLGLGLGFDFAQPERVW